LNMQSVREMDALRKALGLAPDVDPVSRCKELGVDMEATPTPRPTAFGEG